MTVNGIADSCCFEYEWWLADETCGESQHYMYDCLKVNVLLFQYVVGAIKRN